MAPPKIPAAKTSTHPVNVNQTIANAAKNLRMTAPPSTKPKGVKAPTASKGDARPGGDNGMLQQYKQMQKASLW